MEHSGIGVCVVIEAIYSIHVGPGGVNIKEALLKKFVRRFEIGLGGRQEFQPPHLMHRINRDDHFLLIEAVTVNHLTKSIYRNS